MKFAISFLGQKDIFLDGTKLRNILAIALTLILIQALTLLLILVLKVTRCSFTTNMNTHNRVVVANAEAAEEPLSADSVKIF